MVGGESGRWPVVTHIHYVEQREVGIVGDVPDEALGDVERAGE